MQVNRLYTAQIISSSPGGCGIKVVDDESGVVLHGVLRGRSLGGSLRQRKRLVHGELVPGASCTVACVRFDPDSLTGVFDYCGSFVEDRRAVVIDGDDIFSNRFMSDSEVASCLPSIADAICDADFKCRIFVSARTIGMIRRNYSADVFNAVCSFAGRRCCTVVRDNYGMHLAAALLRSPDSILISRRPPAFVRDNADLMKIVRGYEVISFGDGPRVLAFDEPKTVATLVQTEVYLPSRLIWTESLNGQLNHLLPAGANRDQALAWIQESYRRLRTAGIDASGHTYVSSTGSIKTSDGGYLSVVVGVRVANDIPSCEVNLESMFKRKGED